MVRGVQAHKKSCTFVPMKNFVLTLSLTLLCAVSTFARSGEPYFCVTPGATLYYERMDFDRNRLAQTTLFEIDSLITNSDGSKRLYYHVTMLKRNGRPIFGGRTALTMDISAKGDTDMDFGATVMCFVKNVLNVDLTAEGTPAIIPADMKVGDTLPDAHCVVRAPIGKLTIDVTERKVLREETIVTKAGTFKCLVAREHKVENAPFHHVDTWSDSWYAPGMGYVRHDILKDDMTIDFSEKLIKTTNL